MNAKLKSRITIGCAVLGAFLLLEGSMLLGYAPAHFILPTVLLLIAALFGNRWVRVVAICLCVASIALGIRHYERKQHVDAIIRAAHERAQTNSINQ